jgi:hypothetical protein
MTVGCLKCFNSVAERTGFPGVARRAGDRRRPYPEIGAPRPHERDLKVSAFPSSVEDGVT